LGFVFARDREVWDGNVAPGRRRHRFYCQMCQLAGGTRYAVAHHHHQSSCPLLLLIIVPRTVHLLRCRSTLPTPLLCYRRSILAYGYLASLSLMDVTSSMLWIPPPDVILTCTQYSTSFSSVPIGLDLCLSFIYQSIYYRSCFKFPFPWSTCSSFFL
jgi:hypothetical protein